MRHRKSRSAFIRITAILTIALSLTGPTIKNAAAQDELAAAIVRGTCDNPGNVVAELDPLTTAEGGVRTSFGTIDLAISAITDGGHAIAVGDPSAPAACGEIVGEGNDVYLPLPARPGSALAGTAWLHAREDRTQVSLFIGEHLGQVPASGGGDTSAPPEPPADATAEPDQDAGTATYTSPTYGYTLTYDPESWQDVENTTETTSEGQPRDVFVLDSTVINVRARFRAEPWDLSIPATSFIVRYADYSMNLPEFLDAKLRTGADGKPILGGDKNHAFASIDLTIAGEGGMPEAANLYIECWYMPSRDAILVLTYISAQASYDTWAQEREELTAGLSLPN